ncbi:MAG: hypothetical protein NUV91_03815 [Candidatus Omnitrophica bacterium]|nr:hypothetical protein [Candidatus Omnitrophota bacterium]
MMAILAVLAFTGIWLYLLLSQKNDSLMWWILILAGLMAIFFVINYEKLKNVTFSNVDEIFEDTIRWNVKRAKEITVDDIKKSFWELGANVQKLFKGFKLMRDNPDQAGEHLGEVFTDYVSNKMSYSTPK